MKNPRTLAGIFHCKGSTDKFSIILTHLFCPHIVDKSYT